MTLTERVKRKALDLGFQAVGVSRVTSDRPEAARLTEWLAREYHGEMDWMARTAKKRQNPALLLPGIRAIVSVGMNYDTRSEEHTSELQSRLHLVCRLLLEKKKKMNRKKPVRYR